MLTAGMSIRATERTTGLHRDTICKLLVPFGTTCRKFMDVNMRGLKLTHLQFDEQWTWVGRKQARLTVDEKRERHDIGDVYIWTCVDEHTKLMPSFIMGKRSADNARRFMMDVASRLSRPTPHTSDAHGWFPGVSRSSRLGIWPVRKVRRNRADLDDSAIAVLLKIATSEYVGATPIFGMVFQSPYPSNETC